jgi:hypothetical protein
MVKTFSKIQPMARINTRGAIKRARMDVEEEVEEKPKKEVEEIVLDEGEEEIKVTDEENKVEMPKEE